MEKFIYSGILFIFVYIVISMALRLFVITSTYNSHLIGGVLATIAGIGLFMYLLVKGNKEQ